MWRSWLVEGRPREVGVYELYKPYVFTAVSYLCTYIHHIYTYEAGRIVSSGLGVFLFVRSLA